MTIARHFTRVVRYARLSDYYTAAYTAAAGPALYLLMDKLSPTSASKAARAGNLRLVGALGITAGFFRLYTRSSC